MKHLDRAIKDRYIYLDEKKDLLIYLYEEKERKFSNPEEQVELQTYLDLIYEYGYPVSHLRVYPKVQIGSSTREADIVIYSDDRALDPIVVIECKKEKVSPSVFEMAIDQGFSYAAVTDAQYVWATSGDQNAVFVVLPDKLNEREKNRLDRIPGFRELKKPGAAVKRRVGRWIQAPVTTDTLLFSLILILAMIAGSFAVVYFDADIQQFVQSYFRQWNPDYSWVFLLVAVAATLFALGIGLAFMRSHRLFGKSHQRRRLIYFMIFLVLLAPNLVFGVALQDPSWWSRASFLRREFPMLLYLWPYLKSFPVQFLLLYGLMWLSSRGNQS